MHHNLFKMKISITAISFFGAMIHQPLLTDAVHPQIRSSLRLSVPCLVRPDLFVIYYCLFIFSKNSFSFIGSLDKCHTSVFNALILVWFTSNRVKKQHGPYSSSIRRTLSVIFDYFFFLL